MNIQACPGTTTTTTHKPNNAGEVVTYSQIAENIGHPKAARAVANACGANPNPIVVPCHRVIRSDGELGGYSGPGGIKQKRKLLENEGYLI